MIIKDKERNNVNDDSNIIKRIYEVKGKKGE
jgi:hypothetical protein